MPDPALSTTDDSDNGADPDGLLDDPTPIIIADVSIAKEVVGQPTLLSNGNFAVDYQLVIENIGTVDLSDMTLVDDIETQFGASVFQGVSGLTLTTAPTDAASSITLDPATWDGTSATDMLDQSVINGLAIGDFFTIEFTVEIDAGPATGVLDNQATVGGTGVDEDGVPFTDTNGNDITAEDDSDSGAETGDDNTGEPGDTGGSDDPTPTYIPNVSLAKLAGDAVPNSIDGDNFDVTFTLVWENSGNVDLTNLTMFDDIAAEFGNAYLSASGLALQNYIGTGTPPAVNTAWTGDTTQSMISGGTAHVGDTFEIVFTVTIDPDGIDNVSQPLNNQAITSGDGLDENGDPLTDGNGDPITVIDESDNGTDPSSENGEDDGDGTFGNDPTPIIIADVSVVKDVVGIPVKLSNGNFEATYQLVIENTGTVDLADLTLVEDLTAHFGPVFISAGNLTLATAPGDPSSSVVLDSSWNGDAATEMIDQTAATGLAVGDFFAITFTVEIDPDAIGAPPQPFENQVTVGGAAVDANGDPLADSTGDPITATDDSDDGTDPNGDNPNAQGDHGTSDDPTPLLIPDIAIAKVAGDAVPVGDRFRIQFRLNVENTGTVALNSPAVFDDIAAQFGNAFVSAGNLSVVNFVGSGTAPGANAAWTGDTTQSLLDGSGSLDVGDRFQIAFFVDIDPDGVDGSSQPLTNQATATGEGVNPDGTPILDSTGQPATANDVSDNGTDPNGENGEDNGDGIAENDPTPIIIADLAIAKSIVGEPVLTDQGNYVVSFQVAVENTGTVDLASLSLLEDISTQFGSAFVAAGNLSIAGGTSDPVSNIVLDSAGWNGNSSIELLDPSNANILAVGDSFILQFDVEINPQEVTDPLENQVSGSGDAVDANGNPILNSNGEPIAADDVSDSGTDTAGSNSDDPNDQGTSDDPTLFDPPPLPLGQITGTVFLDDSNGDGIQDPGEDGIAGVEVTLTGTDVYGNPVEVTVLTDADGRYAFEGLIAGDYTVTQSQPEGFIDGIDLSGASLNVTNDQFANIQLGFGENLGNSTFAELLPGDSPVNNGLASGNPPRLPLLGPLVNNPISGLISNFIGGPGTIYSGIPINSNANALSLDSGRAVMGGYSSGEQIWGDCNPCEEVINECDPCGQMVDPCGNPMSETIISEGDCGCEAVVPSEPLDCCDSVLLESTENSAPENLEPINPAFDEEAITGSETSSSQNKNVSFLKRMLNWLNV